MRRFKKWIHRYMGFSRGESRGFLVILLILVCYGLGLLWIRQSVAPYNPIPDQLLLDSLVAQLDERQPDAAAAGSEAINLYRFNPNALSEAEWRQFGVPAGVARRIINYRSKAGDYRYKTDLKRIYGLSDTLYARLYPFIDLPAEKPSRQYNTYPDRYPSSRPYPRPERTPRVRTEIASFDLNLADTVALKQIRGIGSKFSARIVTFRDRLGGFHRLEQLAEVYGLPPEMVDSLRKYSYVAPDFSPTRISLNTVTYDDLRAHPYLSNGQARVVIAYRDQHGPFVQVEDLRKIKIIDEALFQKLKPYLTL